jgi:hypothetical protein
MEGPFPKGAVLLFSDAADYDESLIDDWSPSRDYLILMLTIEAMVRPVGAKAERNSGRFLELKSGQPRSRQRED